MKSVVAYIRSLLGWVDESPEHRTSFKRNRVNDDYSSDDELPATKRIKQLQRTSFPTVMTSNDDTWEKEKQSKNVRYIPIQLDSCQPSTSTPIEISKPQSRVRTVPVKLVSVDNVDHTPRKPRMHTPVTPVLHAVVDDDEEAEVTWIETKMNKQSNKRPQLYINLDEEDNQNDNDVIFVKKVTTPPPSQPYKFLVRKNNKTDGTEDDNLYFKIRKSKETNSMSPKPYSKFVAPPGISKNYKKLPVTVPKWMHSSQSTNLLQARNKYQNLINNNGKTRSTIYEVFNLDEKKNYKELIRRVTESMNPGLNKKQTDLVGDTASFRKTQQAQKQALNEIIRVEKRLAAEKENDFAKEYDPITVASLNSSDSEIEIVSETTSSSAKIDPINTLRDLFKDRAILSEDWLSKLDSKYRKKKQETQQKLKEARLESDIISKVNSEQKIAQLEHKLKYELSIPESIIEEPQPTVEFPALSQEQEKLISRALGSGPGSQVLIEKFNLRITRRDLQTLAGLNWLNDEVINFYMNLLMQRSEERKDLPKVYATNTFFYPKLMQSGQAGLRRWTRKVDIFAHDLMVVPVHLGVHWCLSLVDFREKKVSYLDSMGGKNQACLDALLQYLRDEHKDKKGQPFDDKEWKTQCLSKDIPQQMNGSDCGMFACTFAEFSSRNAPYTFSQNHMPYLRRKAALEVLTGKLLL